MEAQKDARSVHNNTSINYGSPGTKQIIKSIRALNNSELSRTNNDQSLKEKLSAIINNRGSAPKTNTGGKVFKVVPVKLAN